MKAIDYLYEKKSRYQLSLNQLKTIAMITMLIDHIGLMLILNGKLYGFNRELYSYAIMLDATKVWRYLYRFCRVVGRISFPIYAFCIVEGFLRTKNLFKYCLRILALAIISEIPFDLMTKNTFFSLSHQNVIWTYFIALLMLTGIRTFKIPVIQFMIFILACIVAGITRVDYGFRGIILIAYFYFMRLDKNLRSIGSAVISFLMSIQNDFGFAAVSSIFIHFYNGKKGVIDMGNLFYLFYPTHMLILFGIVYVSYMLNG